MMPWFVERFWPSRVVWILRFLLGLIFVHASIGKILDPKTFAESLMAYQILESPSLIKYVAVTLPWVEWFCGVFLLLGVFVRSVSVLTSTLLVLFVLAMVSALLRGLDINCGCFGSADESIGPLSLIRDGLFLGISLVVMTSRIDPFTLQALISNRRSSRS
jgi:putative oxidoreductase